MLATDLHVDRIPTLYKRFASEIGESHWRRIASDLKKEIKGNAFLRDYLTREYAVVFQLCGIGDHISRYGMLQSSLGDLRPAYQAGAFMAQVLSLVDSWPPSEAEKLRRRVHGALKNPADLRGLQLELAVATHFARRGWSVEWPETLGVADETFDHLINIPGIAPLEVECKSIGEDKGSRVTRREVLDFYKLLNPHLKATTQGLSQGLSAVVTLPGRVPTAYRDRVGLAKAVGQAIFQGASKVLPDGTDIRIADFDTASLGLEPQKHKPHDLRKAIDGVTATQNRQAVLVGTSNGGVLALAVQCAKDDLFMKATFDTLSGAAQQLTGKRAGMLVAAFDGLTGDQLLSVAADDHDSQSPPSALQIAASKFLSSASRESIVGLVFFSRSGLQPAVDGLVDAADSGTAYHFPKRESSHWNEAYSGLFNPRQ